MQRRLWSRVRVTGVVDLQLDDLNFKMYSNWDDGIVDALYFKNRNYSELNELRLFTGFAKNANTILDVGANTGLYSILSYNSQPNAKIFAFEPYTVNMTRLQKNTALNSLSDNFTPVAKAVGNSNEMLSFTVPENDQVCDVLSADSEFTNKFYRKWINYKQIDVPQVTLNGFVKEQALSSVDLIKIDVENFELSVLQGALEVLEAHSPVIFIEIFVNPEKVAFYEEHLKPLGYSCYLVMHEGLMRTETLLENPDCRNFILSKAKPVKDYLSYQDIPELIATLSAT